MALIYPRAGRALRDCGAWEPRVVDGRIWQPQTDGISGATIIRLTDCPRFAFSAPPVASGPRVITFVSQCTIPQLGEEFLI